MVDVHQVIGVGTDPLVLARPGSEKQPKAEREAGGLTSTLPNKSRHTDIMVIFAMAAFQLLRRKKRRHSFEASPKPSHREFPGVPRL